MVTRKDIANRLQVSLSVVSRALNGTGYVQQEKREKILMLAKELGYTREPSALVRGGMTTHRILFCCGNICNPFYVEMYNGICEAARAKGYNVLLAPGLGTEFNVADGVIFANENIAFEGLSNLGKRHFFPAVAAAFGEHLRMPRAIPIVECDLWHGVEAMISYLRRRGHDKIAMCSPYPIEMNNTRGLAWRNYMEPVLGERVGDYYIQALANNMLQVEAGTAIAYDGFFENGVYAATRFIASGCDATAVICFNEEMGLGFCRELQSRGWIIPDSLSVASFDGTFMRRHYELPLTVLDLCPRQMGINCFRLLCDMIDGKRVRRMNVQATDILEGATVRDISRL